MLCGAGFTDAAARQAAARGVGMVAHHLPYSVRPWLLYQSRDPLSAVHGRAGIDAVVVATPYERVRYHAYLDALQDIRVTPAMVEAMRRKARNSVGFLVYAHSRTSLDRTFLAAFRPAPATHFGPALDFYDVGSFREQRWVGSVTYRFPVRNCSEQGVLHFTDGEDARYRFAYDLSRYR